MSEGKESWGKRGIKQDKDLEERERRRKEGRKEGRKKGWKEGRKEGR